MSWAETQNSRCFHQLYSQNNLKNSLCINISISKGFFSHISRSLLNQGCNGVQEPQRNAVLGMEYFNFKPARFTTGAGQKRSWGL